MAAPIEEFDVTPYIRPPMFDVAGGIGLAVALITAAPKKLPANARKALTVVRTSAVKVQQVWADHDRAGKPVDARPADLAIDHAWSALFARLDAYAGLTTRTPSAVRALQLRDSLFPDGLGFLKANYEAEWAESRKRLDRIDAEKLAADLERLAGAEFLAEVRGCHKTYGDAIGVTRAAADPAAALVGPMRELRRAIPAYALQVIAATDMQSEAEVAALRAALQPIDSTRAGIAARSGNSGGSASGSNTPSTGSGPGGTPSTPIPQVQS